MFDSEVFLDDEELETLTGRVLVKLLSSSSSLNLDTTFSRWKEEYLEWVEDTPDLGEEGEDILGELRLGVEVWVCLG